MPRSGWLAVGAIVAGLAAAPEHGRAIVAVPFLALSVLIVAWAVRNGGRGAGPGGETVAIDAAGRAIRASALIAIGALLIAGRTIAAPPAAGSPSGPLPTGSGPWTGVVLSVSAPRAGQQPAVVRLDPPAAISIAGTLPVFPAVVPGDHVRLVGPLRAPPVDDPYGTYLARINVAATVRVSELVLIPPSGDLGRNVEGLRRGADQALRLAVPEPEAGLASGILIGLRDRVDRDLSGAFTAVGATHVVAISGWNIAIVASSLAALAGGMARRRRAVLTALAIVAYVAFVGPSPSVVRAAGMAGVVMLARELGRPSRAAAAIGWAVTMLLAVDPGLVADVGFQLSALATVGLIAWGTSFTRRLAGASPGRPRAWLAESLGVSLAAQLATLPIVVLTFGRLSLVAPVINLGVVPLVAPAMAAGVVALAGGLAVMAGLPSTIATIVGLPAWFLFSLMVGVVRAGAALPFASVSLEPPWDALVGGFAALGILGIMMWARTRARPSSPGARAADPPGPRATNTKAARGVRDRGPISIPWHQTLGGRLFGAALTTAVVALSVVAIHRPDGVPRISVLDVGQGDAILVEGGRGGRMLVDGGPDPGRLLVALDERLPPWDRRIDVIVLSHPHEDHAAGLAALLDRYAVSRVFEPGMFGPGPGYAALNAELFEGRIRRGTLATGDRLTVDEFEFRVLWPDPGSVPERPSDGGKGINNVSIVLLGEVGRHRLLLAGDVEEEIDQRLLALSLPHLALLKVAHHGSRTSSTEAFLRTVTPAVAVISAGRSNPYGHPSPATVARLEAEGSRVLRTDLDGTVSIELGPGPLRVRTDGPRAAANVGDPAASGRFAASAARFASAAGLLCGLPDPLATLVASGVGPLALDTTEPVAQPGSTLAAGVRVRLRYDAVRDRPPSEGSGVPVSAACCTRSARLVIRRACGRRPH